MKINIFWFRRDLRLDDNTGLIQAFKEGVPVLPVFIFDTNIIDELPEDDPRITFIHTKLSDVNHAINKSGSSLLVLKGEPEAVWKRLIVNYDINAVYVNKEYEPYSIARDIKIENILGEKGISLFRFKDHVIFEEKEIVKPDNKPYVLYTPYKKRWLSKLSFTNLMQVSSSENIHNYFKCNFRLPSYEELGFRESRLTVCPYDLSIVREYDKFRDLPSLEKTTYLGPHLRYGIISIRKLVNIAFRENQVFLGELIWREFFMNILFNFPHVVTENFRSKYDNIKWINNEDFFERWCNGQTGYPMVDAGMRQLNETGYMHNRLRMVTSAFLCKHLLIDWRWGEAYFAMKLLDYEQSSNNGNWQWAAGTGCDAAPYFRIFNPATQQMKYDRNNEYIRKWVNSTGSAGYPEPIVEHTFARRRAIDAYKVHF